MAEIPGDSLPGDVHFDEARQTTLRKLRPNFLYASPTWSRTALPAGQAVEIYVRDPDDRAWPRLASGAAR